MLLQETFITPTSHELSAVDQDWLDNFGVDPSWQLDPELVNEINTIISVGSLRLEKDTNENVRQEVIDARKKFIDFVGIDEDTLDDFSVNNPALVSLDNFIGTQRLMKSFGLDGAKIIDCIPSAMGFAKDAIQDKVNNLIELGLDATKIINSQPTTIGLAPESVRVKVNNLTDLGLDVTKIINTQPSIMTLAPESIRTKMTNLTELGLDATKIVNAQPSIMTLAPESISAKMVNLTELGLDVTRIVNAQPSVLCYAPDSVRSKLENLTEVGLDAVKIVNTQPSIISLAPESIRTKMTNLTELGLDAVKIVNAQPATIKLASASIRAKVKRIDRSIKVLNWEHSTKELIEEFPTVLGMNKHKISIFTRIAAEQIEKAGRAASPREFGSILMKPLELYILSIQDTTDKYQTVGDFKREALKNRKLDATERKRQARELADTGVLGKIGTKYLAYSK